MQHSTLQLAADSRGAAAADRERSKIAKYRQLCAQHNLDFAPFVVETYGAIGPSAISIIHDIAVVLSRRLDLLMGPLKKRIFTELSTVLQRSQARAILARRPSSTSRFGALPPSRY